MVSILSFLNQSFIQHVEHFQKAHFSRNITHLIGNEITFGIGIRLAPDFQFEVNCFVFHDDLFFSLSRDAFALGNLLNVYC